MLTTVFASQTVLRRFVGHSGRVWASARAPLRLPVPMQQMQQLLQRGRQFYSTASTSGDNNNKSMPPNPPATAAKREMTPDEQAALKFMKLTPSQKVASYVFKSKIVVALLKYGPAFGGESCAATLLLRMWASWPCACIRCLSLPFASFFFFSFFLLTCGCSFVRGCQLSHHHDHVGHCKARGSWFPRRLSDRIRSCAFRRWNL